MQERTISSSQPFNGRLISVRVDEVERDDGHRARREVVVHPGAVGILAWDGERIALVRQWRHAVRATLLEIPAGTVDPDEEPAATARRELAEETGLVADEWQAGPSFYTAPGFCTERLSLFLATGLRSADADEASPPEDEAIELVWMPLLEAVQAVDDGRIADAKSIAGIGWLSRRIADGGA